MRDIQNIFCIGRNYAQHAKELGNEVPSSPILFTKPTNALALADGQTLSYPNGKGEIHHELEIVLKIGSAKGSTHVDERVVEMALGIDLTLRDMQSELKKKGHPWERAKGFRNSAIVTPFWAFPGVEAIETVLFSLQKNGETLQEGKSTDMLFNFQRVLDECEQAFGLSEGDVIYTGTPEGVGPISDGDVFTLLWDGQEKGSFKVSM
ncbi:fumarylacetoacetate hydrolase family protein [Alkalicoccobacillus porphyridii]|uniref:Fumarylacetoacetate hydrolase family protein n=1 Tax=Alkalicoccobacillus porphyridii TaxID=2597270 RepID=A0A553ZWR1_9BACI|nr:fumarylacetoacetate hydrolase family protein [Alkalicoccobacillus porphyridii]TSB45825.1 fumarylacetoacetate hydrolase family protein [Alkalicoccobacillus porphyridii]